MDIQIAFPLDPPIITLLAVLSLPHILYAFCWMAPKAFISIAKSIKTVPLELFYQVRDKSNDSSGDFSFSNTPSPSLPP